jgi:hypothetical protein
MITGARRVLATFSWRQWLLAAVFLVALLAAGMFAFRTVRSTIYWPLHRDEPIERWMPVNYVAHSYDVPPEVLWSALGLPDPRTEKRRDMRPLSAIATARGQSFEQVRATLEEAIARTRQSRQPPLLPTRSDRGVP